jgi:predicted MFS family arabinose efflux permease
MIIVDVQRRVIRVLLAVQMVSSIVIAMAGPMVSLLAERMTGSAGGAGLTQAGIFCGSVLFTIPLTVLSMSRGRRFGLAAGHVIGAVSAAAIVIGSVSDAYPVVVAGAVGLGAAIAAGFQTRFAATDLAGDGRHGRAIGAITWASTAGGVLGPSMVGFTDEVIPAGLPEFTSPFVVIAVGLAVTSTLAFALLRPDPLLVARAQNRDEPPPPRRRIKAGLTALLANPEARRAVIVLTTVHAIMIALMNMVAIHMHGAGTTLSVVGLAISVHVAAMYLPGPLVGYLADKLGARRLMAAGLALQVLAAVTLQGAPPHSPEWIGLGLALLGLGWAAAFVSGSAMLSSAVSGPTGVLAQGASDLIIQITTAASAVLAGVVVATWTYEDLARAGGVAVLAVLVWVLVSDSRRKRERERAALVDIL